MITSASWVSLLIEINVDSGSILEEMLQWLQEWAFSRLVSAEFRSKVSYSLGRKSFPMNFIKIYMNISSYPYYEYHFQIVIWV